MHPSRTLRRVLSDWPGPYPMAGPKPDGPNLRVFPTGGWYELVQRIEGEGAPTEPMSRLRRLARVAELYAAGVAEGSPRLNVTIGELLGRSPTEIQLLGLR